MIFGRTLTRILPVPEAAASPGNPTDALLVRQALAGEREGFEGLVALYGRRVYRFLHHLTRHSQDAEDLTQVTFVKAHTHLASFDTGRPFVNWLLTIARREAVSHFRRSRRWESLPEDSLAPGATPLDAAERAMELENIWDKARRLLAAREYEALWLRFGEDLSTQETAEILGVSQAYVKILVFRGKGRLRKAVEDLGA